MKNLFWIVGLVIFSCGKSELVNEDYYGSYLSVDTLQEIQLFNFAEPYIYVMKKDSVEERYYDWDVFDGRVFDGEGNYIFEVVRFKGRDLKLIDKKRDVLLEFKNKY